MTKKNERLVNRIIATMQIVWEKIGPDTIQLCQEVDGRSYASREEVIEMVTDADRTRCELKGEELEYYKKLSYKEVEKIARLAFPYKRYGM